MAGTDKLEILSCLAHEQERWSNLRMSITRMQGTQKLSRPGLFNEGLTSFTYTML
jgi:hypothetical protein